jgi:hypothetical protein
MVGLAAAFSFSASELVGAVPGAALMLAAACGLFAAATDFTLAWKQRQLRAELNGDNLEQVIGAGSIPVVMSDNDLVMQLWHYKPDGIANRLWYLLDEKAALEFDGWNTTERAFAGLQPWTRHIQVEKYDVFTSRCASFVLIEGVPSHIIRRLLQEGAAITATGVYRGHFVFHVDRLTSPAAGGRPCSGLPSAGSSSGASELPAPLR